MRDIKTIRIFKRRGKKESLVARVHVTRKEVEVFDEIFRNMLSIVFETPRAKGLMSDVTPSGVCIASAQKFLEPWTAEAIEYVVDYELPLSGLRVETSSTSVRKYHA